MNLLDKEWRERKVLTWTYGGLWVFITAFLWAPSRDGLEGVYALTFFIPILFVLSLDKIVLYLRCGWYLVFALIYASYAASTTLWSSEPDLGYFLLQLFILFSWFYGAIWVFSKKEFDIDVLLDWLIIVGIFVGASLLMVFYINNDFYARLIGWSVLRNPNQVGGVFGALTLFAYLKWLMARNIIINLKYFIAAVILSVPLLASQSRGAILALVIIGFVALTYLRPSILKIALHIFVIFLLVIGVLMNSEDLLAVFSSRMGDGERTLVWGEIFFRSIHEHFLFGVGMEKEGRIIIPDLGVFNHAHNAWLDIFYRTGVVGLILALIHLFYILNNFSTSKKLLPLYLWLMYGCLTAMVDSRGFFWQIDVRWFMYWIPAGLITALHVVSHPLFLNNSDAKKLEASG